MHERPDRTGRAPLLWRGRVERDRLAGLADVAVLAAAASDLDARRLPDHSERLRVDGVRGVIDILRAKSSLRPGHAPERATHVMVTLVSPAAYRAPLPDLGWPHAA
jgi:hypothetical protein